VFVDQLLVLADLRCAGIRCPTGRVDVAEADVNVRVVFDFFEFSRRVVGNEHEGELGVVKGRRGDHGTGVKVAIGAVGCKHGGSRGLDDLMKSSDLFLGTEARIFGVGGVRVESRGRHFVWVYSHLRGFIPATA